MHTPPLWLRTAIAYKYSTSCMSYKINCDINTGLLVDLAINIKVIRSWMPSNWTDRHFKRAAIDVITRSLLSCARSASSCRLVWLKTLNSSYKSGAWVLNSVMIPSTDNSLKWSTVLGPWKMQWWGCSGRLIWVSNIWVEMTDTCCYSSSLTLFCRRWIWCRRIAICSEELSEMLVTLVDVSPPSQIVSIPNTSALLFPDAGFQCLEIVHWLYGITTV